VDDEPEVFLGIMLGNVGIGQHDGRGTTKRPNRYAGLCGGSVAAASTKWLNFIRTARLIFHRALIGPMM
jgi:hypothetical protein